MRSKSSVLTPLFVILTILTAIPAIPSLNPLLPNIPRVSAATVPDGPWVPYGPLTTQLLMHVYDGDLAEFNGFTVGGSDGIDYTDWPINPDDVAGFCATDDYVCSGAVDEFGQFELDFNQHNSFLGVSQQTGYAGSCTSLTPWDCSTKQPTSAGVEIRKALAHLLDKPKFVQLNAALKGLGKYTDIQVPPATAVFPNASSVSSQFVGVQAQAEINKDLTAHSWTLTTDCSGGAGSITNVVSAYNICSDNIIDPVTAAASVGYSGISDLRAACDHLHNAPVSIPFAAGTTSCAQVAAGTGKLDNAGLGTLLTYIRTHPPRKNFGTIIADGLDSLFSSAVTTRTVTGITQVAPIVFKTGPEVDDWHIYTAGWFLGPFPDHLYALYYSQFASNLCGGKKSSFAQNYNFYCSPAYDKEAYAGQFSSTLGAAYSHFTNAAVIAHENAMTVPVYSGAGNRFVALNGWNGLINVAGHGYQSKFFNLLNMRQQTGYTPTLSKYTPGGGDPNLMRIGMREGTQHLSLFHATTVWEFDMAGQVYDSMLASNPLNPTQVFDWMTKSHSVSTFSGSSPGSNIACPVATCTLLRFNLRNDLKWHDGADVTAADVVFSVLKFRDVPSANLLPAVVDVVDAKAIGTRTVDVVDKGVSVFFELNIGGVPIIPEHVWGGFSDAQLADPSLDPMALGLMTGSGPWVCRNIDTGAVGGSCAQAAAGGSPIGQAVDTGGRFLLTANSEYMRAPSIAGSGGSLMKQSWADQDDSGKVDIVDIAKAATAFGTADPYFDNLFGATDGIVDISDIANMANYFDHSLVGPVAPTSATGLDLAKLDPFRIGTAQLTAKSHHSSYVATVKIAKSPGLNQFVSGTAVKLAGAGATPIALLGLPDLAAPVACPGACVFANAPTVIGASPPGPPAPGVYVVYHVVEFNGVLLIIWVVIDTT